VFFEVIHMRKFLSVSAATAFLIVSLGQSFAAVARGPATSSSHSTTGPWAVACGAGAFASLAIGSAIKANEQRQLTVTEATWHAAVCPVFLPIALISTFACTDNRATLQVARLAFLFVQKHPGADQSAFTNAYVEACQGSLSRATLRTLRGLAR
jgi:hypothetical protein